MVSGTPHALRSYAHWDFSPVLAKTCHRDRIRLRVTARHHVA